MKFLSIPFEVVLGRKHQGIAIASARGRQFGQSPVRCLALAIDAEATGACHYDEAIVLLFAVPAADAVTARRAHLLLCIALRQIYPAVVLLLETPAALEMHVEPARTEGHCAPGRRPHHL